MTTTVFLAAETDAETYARLTGLVLGRGFVVENGLPVGLYPDPMAARIGAALGEAKINHHPTPARTYREGRQKLRHLLAD